MPRFRLNPLAGQGVEPVQSEPVRQQNGYVSVIRNLREMGDVNLGTPSNGQALTYDTATSKWTPKAVTTDTSALAPLDSPTFTGNPQTPYPPGLDITNAWDAYDTTIANTKWVSDNINMSLTYYGIAIPGGPVRGVDNIGDDYQGGTSTVDTLILDKSTLRLYHTTDGSTFQEVSTTEGVVALTDGMTIAVNAALGTEFAVTLGGNRTIANPTNPVTGRKLMFRFTQDATGSRTVTWGTAYRFSGGAPPTLTTTPSKTDYLGFIYNEQNDTWDCLAVRLDY